MRGFPRIAPLTRYAEGLRQQGLGEVPDFDPLDGGVEAQVLFLFEKPPIPSFDEAAALAEIAERNSLRLESQLPLLNATQEITRLKKAYDSDRWADRFYGLAASCIDEIYGSITPADFNSMSAMDWFFTCKQNIIHGLIRKKKR